MIIAAARRRSFVDVVISSSSDRGKIQTKCYNGSPGAEVAACAAAFVGLSLRRVATSHYVLKRLLLVVA